MPPMPLPHERDMLPKPLRVVVVLLVLTGGLGCAATAFATASGRGVEMFVMLW